MGLNSVPPGCAYTESSDQSYEDPVLSQQRVEATDRVQASPAQVYAILADYRQHHPRILPPRYFKKLEVEQGGVGAGTVFRIHGETMGRQQSMRGEVSEPEPGRVLAEAFPEAGMLTTFRVEPAPEGEGTQVTIATEWSPRAGLLGKLESLVMAYFMRRVYAEELKLLDAYARQNPA